MTDYDVIVAGCGPGGLMACGELAKRGVTVLGVDKKPRLNENIRSASGFFFADVKFNNECITLEHLGSKTRIHYADSGFAIDYSASMEGIHHSHMFTDTGRHWQASTRKKPFYNLFVPSRWLSDRYNWAKGNGAQFLTGTVVLRVKQTEQQVEVVTRSGGKKKTLTCRKLIASDGLSSRIARTLGANKDRKAYHAIGATIEYEVTDVDCPYDRGDMFFFGAKHFGGRAGMLLMIPSPKGKNAFRIETMSMLHGSSGTDIIEYFTTQSSYAPWFKKMKVLEKSAALVELLTPMITPYMGNILFVGDSAAWAECLYQCATMAGYMGGICTEMELKGKRGFKEYSRWWGDHFEWVKNPKRMADYGKRVFFPRFFTIREIDFLFELSEKKRIVVDEAQATPYDYAAMVFQQFMAMPEVPDYLKERMQEIIDADQAKIATVIGKVQRA